MEGGKKGWMDVSFSKELFGGGGGGGYGRINLNLV